MRTHTRVTMGSHIFNKNWMHNILMLIKIRISESTLCVGMAPGMPIGSQPHVSIYVVADRLVGLFCLRSCKL